jgi:hypothetical protein
MFKKRPNRAGKEKCYVKLSAMQDLSAAIPARKKTGFL